MKLYHREHTGRPLRVLWTLEELGQPYELELMTYEVGKSEEHFARHPLGRVPVIDDGEGYVFESAAICLQLADLHPEGAMIAPLGSHERALVYQWAVFAPSELEPPAMEAAIFKDADPERAAKARERFSAAADAVERSLDGRDFLVGDRLTVADVMVSTAVNFANRAGFGELLGEAVKAYLAALQERPAFQRAREAASQLPAAAE
ncbi:MAG TPA: glutathione S-transferase family protein [Solirubrobacteraceae bacterium]|nr:glutathione S-transferase family protein [Solirubrobacteraceae bacterium]